MVLRFATFLAPSMKPVYQFIADYVGVKLGVSSTLSVGESFSAFANRQADIGFICGFPYVELADQPEPSVELVAAPILQGQRYGGKPIYFSDVIVNCDSEFHSVADLRGRSWAYNDKQSQSGYNVVRWWFGSHGEAHPYFSKVILAGSHQRSIDLVLKGHVDAAAIDSQVLAITMRERPELAARLRVIDSFGPSSTQPVVVARHINQHIKADVQAILLSMHDDPIAREVLNQGLIERFAAVTDHDYDDIRAMRAIAQDVDLGDESAVPVV